MLNTDVTALFKQITSGVSEYLMFLGLLVMMYLFIVALIKLVTDSITTIIIVIRSPITSALEDLKEEE